jgi:hypothetical protein
MRPTTITPLIPLFKPFNIFILPLFKRKRTRHQDVCSSTCRWLTRYRLIGSFTYTIGVRGVKLASSPYLFKRMILAVFALSLLRRGGLDRWGWSVMVIGR